MDDDMDINSYLLQNFESVSSALSGENHALQTMLCAHYAVLKIKLFQRWGRMKDLEEAIEKGKLAVEGTAIEHEDFAGRLNNLGVMLESRFERTGKMEDLEEAIRVSRQAVEVMPEDHPGLAACLNNLGNKLESRFERTGKMEDLEEAIRVSRQAVEVTPEDHPDLAACLNNLGNELQRRFERTGKMEDLEEAIRVSRQAVEVTPEDHPDLAGRLTNVGNKLLLAESSKSEALPILLQAWNSHTAIPFVRLRASTTALRLLRDQGEYNSAYKLSIDAIDLLPRVHNRSLSHLDQQHIVSLFSGLATNACSLALQIGEPPEKALELLEQGRGVILSLLIDDRSDTSELKAANPDLCTLYESLRLEVNKPTDNIVDQRLREMALERRPKAIDELDQCVEKIRQLPNFGRFQKGFTAKQMQGCSVGGCIVVVNITDLRSDAVIVSLNGFKAIPLLDLDASKAKTWIDQDLTTSSSKNRGPKNKSFLLFLSWLWQGCVKPVLDELAYTAQDSMEDLPRIWWIGTGLASAFPFHAAGDLSTGPMESAYCRVVSSYSPSIKALTYARERVSAIATLRHDPLKILIVTMPKTPDAEDLPGARAEKSEVVAAVGTSMCVETLDQPDVASVMDQIQHCNIAHFACHGVSDRVDPSESGLLMQTTGTATTQPRQDVFSVRKASQAHLSGAEIAYLSACSTAENQAVRLVDEVLHVVSGFQVAGFRHVVGCLWPSSDRVCIQIAKSFYSELVRDGAIRYSDRAVALALHKAVVQIWKSDEYRKRPLYWAQYVHFGA